MFDHKKQYLLDETYLSLVRSASPLSAGDRIGLRGGLGLSGGVLSDKTLTLDRG